MQASARPSAAKWLSSQLHRPKDPGASQLRTTTSRRRTAQVSFPATETKRTFPTMWPRG